MFTEMDQRQNDIRRIMHTYNLPAESKGEPIKTALQPMMPKASRLEL
jgi:hypothetical protein